MIEPSDAALEAFVAEWKRTKNYKMALRAAYRIDFDEADVLRIGWGSTWERSPT